MRNSVKGGIGLGLAVAAALVLWWQNRPVPVPGPVVEATIPQAAPAEFDVVRVTPDGQAVIAGRAAPGQRVEIVLDGAVVGGADADAAGDFATVLEIAPSSEPRELVLRTPSGEGAGDLVALAPSAATGQGEAAAQAEAERIAAEAAEAAKAETERLAADKAAAEKADADRLAAARAEAERLAAEAAKAEAERMAAEAVKAVAERLAAEKAEAERIAAAKAEAERLAAVQAEAERIAAAQAEAERLAAEKAEAERAEATMAETEPVAAEAASAARLAAEKAAREKAEAERLAAEKAQADRLAAAQAEAARIAAAQAEAERLAANKAEAERLAAEKAEAARVAAEKAAAARIAAEKAEAARVAAEEAEIAGSAEPRVPQFTLSTPVIILPQADADSAPVLVKPGPDEVSLLQPAAAEPGAGIVLDRITYSDRGDLIVAGRGKARTLIRVYVNAALKAEIRCDADGQWQARIAADVAQSAQLLRFDEIGADGTVLSRLETPFDYSPLASVQEVRQRKIVVQKGDYLWKFAEQYYGAGIRYSVIFSANSELIRDPDLIYPGQVFTVPELVNSQ